MLLLLEEIQKGTPCHVVYHTFLIWTIRIGFAVLFLLFVSMIIGSGYFSQCAEDIIEYHVMNSFRFVQ